MSTSAVRFNSATVHAFTVGLLETFYESGDDNRVTDAELEKMRGNDDFIDNDEFVFAYEEHIWTDDNVEKFGDVCKDEKGYFVSDEGV